MEAQELAAASAEVQLVGGATKNGKSAPQSPRKKGKRAAQKRRTRMEKKALEKKTVRRIRFRPRPAQPRKRKASQ